jgi:methyl-accepting chemotaxis protein
MLGSQIFNPCVCKCQGKTFCRNNAAALHIGYCGMSEQQDLSKRLDFNQIDQGTRTVLRENAALIAVEMPKVLEQFYQHIGRHAEASAFFKDRAHMNYAREAQLRHWLVIAKGEFDQSYVASVRRIGEAHARLGLEPQLYLGGYSFLLCGLVEAIGQKLQGNRQADKRGKLQTALIKAALLDMDMVIAVYVDIERRQRQGIMDQVTKVSLSITDIAGAVSAAAIQLEATARGLSGSTDATTRESTAVAAASSDVAMNVQTVAAATEELSASIREISEQVRKSAQFAEGAVGSAKQSSAQVVKLQQSASEIGSVVSLINAIAAQTNLLALNATIEAARAGESGRGFAVVAQEVKSLAEQTTRATSEIAEQIKAIQTATSDTAKAIGTVVGTIEQISSIALALSSAVDEQGSATQEIAHNASGVSQRIADVSRSANAVDRAAREASSGASEVLAVASELARNGEKLRHTISELKVA